MKVQWQGSKESWDKIMALGVTEWSPGEMGTNTFYLETPDGIKKVLKGDWVIKNKDGDFLVRTPQRLSFPGENL